MNPNSARYCPCGTRLARDNRGSQCAACQAKARDVVAGSPDVPADFWNTDHMRDALATWHMGRVIAAYRKHPFHGLVLRQEIVAGWMGITQAQLSRIESGPPIRDLDKLIHWARALGIPPHLLWFKLPQQGLGREPPELARRMREEDPQSGMVGVGRHAIPDTDEMHRREFLRLLSMAGLALATSSVADHLDVERLDYFASRPGRLDAETVEEYAALNTHLWRVFASIKSKGVALPLVQEQLDVLTGSLQGVQDPPQRRRLCALTSDLFQLAGEIFFDGNHYTDAAHCYALAATAAKEADAFDLWACAMVRHAFIDVYERRCDKAVPVLELAAGLARRGDGTLSTRHWVNAVRAQALAGIGDVDACQRALDLAEDVRGLNGEVQNGGWLRFDGSRLAEERGTCYVALRHPDLAEAALTQALGQKLSLRRRGIVLTDLAMVGVQRRDPDHMAMYADAALDTARQSGSGVIVRKLQGLRLDLAPFLGDSRVRNLDKQIMALNSASDAR
jgi:transcriptional regulator with XRE-family HTH domain